MEVGDGAAAEFWSRIESKSDPARTKETQTDPVRILSPGEPGYGAADDLVSETPEVVRSGSGQSVKVEATQMEVSSDLGNETVDDENIMDGQSTKLEESPVIGEEIADDEIVIDVDGDASDFEPAAKKGKGAAKPKKAPVKKTKVAPKKKGKATTADKGKAKKFSKATKRSAAEDEEDSTGKKKKLIASIQKGAAKGKQSKYPDIDPDELSDLSLLYPDPYWHQVPGADDDPNSMINHINEAHPLSLLTSADIRDHGHITSMVQSPDGRMLATFCTMGTVRIWDTETWKVVQVLRDADEANIDEFYCGRFTPDMRRIVVGGKLKDPHKWSEVDDDNHILPCPLKIFDLVTGKVVERLEGHEEEVLCIKAVQFKGENYYVTTSQDGYVLKWRMGENWSTLMGSIRMEDGDTCMAFNVSFLPNCGNKYLVAACDGGINIFDFESAQKIQNFPNIYSCYCDCVKVVRCLDYPAPPRTWDDVLNSDGHKEMFAYLTSRGVEEVQMVDGEDIAINTVPNTVTLHKIIYPSRKGDPFKLEEVKRFAHDEYCSNSWLTKISSNGRYVFAPTYDGGVVIFNMETTAVAGVLRDHEGVEVRDVVVGWRSKWLATCGDDGTVKIYVQPAPNAS
ncbi:hypothetical protein PhCBS80983_g05130 [Powellomyces hirtus]|uniref:Uncharacterized protein n=1 Tax=Powellomyces hirtus TaxID=109895 RepID=A0A507DXP6_9FUNG|nr:hypothetical protein PhCBS80983_g05130 [Powellomyces hirtus]